MQDKTTTIEVSHDHHARLQLRKRTGESFDDVIGRLLEESEISVDDELIDQMTA
jgi:predicted CopG family antitoxin